MVPCDHHILEDSYNYRADDVKSYLYICVYVLACPSVNQESVGHVPEIASRTSINQLYRLTKKQTYETS